MQDIDKTIDFYKPIFKSTLDFHLLTLHNVNEKELEAIERNGTDEVVLKAFEE